VFDPRGIIRHLKVNNVYFFSACFVLRAIKGESGRVHVDVNMRCAAESSCSALLFKKKKIQYLSHKNSGEDLQISAKVATFSIYNVVVEIRSRYS